MLRQIPGWETMCGSLEGYAALAAALPPEGAVWLATDAAEPAASERFYCAQHALAPRVLARWVPAQDRELPGSVLMLHFDDRGAREAFLGELRAAALRQGAGLRSSEPVPGILVVRVEKG